MIEETHRYRLAYTDEANRILQTLREVLPEGTRISYATDLVTNEQRFTLWDKEEDFFVLYVPEYTVATNLDSFLEHIREDFKNGLPRARPTSDG